ncbi:MAG: DUF4118 domain-containing protein [Butyribacter sp.]|nr:DUF4118 domain-containing protein [bacterium]MDY3854206.1 DUF4118 domain-containing protein [Butyribacter sp.]
MLQGTKSYLTKRRKKFVFCVQDIMKSAGALLLTTGIAFLFQRLGFTEANIITVYILSVLIISLVTVNPIYGLLSSAASVIIFNFFFTEPKYTLFAYEQGYPVTFLVMFLSALITGTLASELKEHAHKSAQAAYRTKILLDTEKLLGKAKDSSEMMQVTARQLVKLFCRDTVLYAGDDLECRNPFVCMADEEKSKEEYLSEKEKNVARWVMEHNQCAGASTKRFPDAKCLYLALRVNDSVYGVAGIAIAEKMPDDFEKEVLLSLLGECALALENDKNAREKEEAAIMAKNEQLRANLLRSISHDLRTPLTSISGNASNLMANEACFDSETRQQLYSDIYDDSMWLIGLVENLLAITRIEEGRVNLHLSVELMDEVVKEALKHITRKKSEHHISIQKSEEFLLAKIDTRLIVQVIINLVDNAIKYTPKDSNIEIKMKKENGLIVISVADDGPGIAKQDKEHIFEMFYSGQNKVADSKRSLGLGLALCKSIINAHGGELQAEDRVPHGAVFSFTLPAEEVSMYE